MGRIIALCLMLSVVGPISSGEAAQVLRRRPAEAASSSPAASAVSGASSAIPGASSMEQSETKPVKIDVEGFKKNYWTESGGTQVKVLQNRIYTKGGRLNLELTGGSFSGDPFITSWLFGGQLGFYFTEYLGLHALYWKFATSTNAAYTTLVAATTTSTSTGYGSNSNQMDSLMGGEVSWSLLYGKLSLLSLSIIHFDIFLVGGAGLFNVNTGATSGVRSFSTIAFWPGLGEQIFFTQWLTLKAMYRLPIYSEDVVERNTPATMGTVLSKRSSLSPVFTVGVNFLF